MTTTSAPRFNDRAPWGGRGLAAQRQLLASIPSAALLDEIERRSVATDAKLVGFREGSVALDRETRSVEFLGQTCRLSGREYEIVDCLALGYQRGIERYSPPRLAQFVWWDYPIPLAMDSLRKTIASIDRKVPGLIAGTHGGFALNVRGVPRQTGGE